MAEKINGWDLSTLNPSEAALKGVESTGSMNSGLVEGKTYEMIIVGTNPEPAKAGDTVLEWHCELVAARNVDDGTPIIEAIVGIKPFVMAGFAAPAAREAAKFTKTFTGKFRKDGSGKKIWSDVSVKDTPAELSTAIKAKYAKIVSV